nr:CHAD domain-containing protein [uncultured Cohaesibacter sp.]
MDMAQIHDKFLFLPGRSLDSFVGEDFGRIKPTFSKPMELADCSLLDMFHQPLLRSNRLLVSSEGRLYLFGHEMEPIKQKGPANGGLVSGLPKGPVRRALDDLSDLRALMPLCHMRISTTLMTLVDDEGKIYLKTSFMDVHMPDGDCGLIAFLRPVRGYDRALALMQDKLTQLGASEMGLAAFCQKIDPSFPARVGKPKFSIDPSEVASCVATRIMAAYMPVIRLNENGIVEDIDTEFLHDYRIALRKIRSVLSLFKGIYSDEQTKDLKQRFSSLMAKTGRLRDLDVYLLEKKAFFSLVPEALHPGLSEMFAVFSLERGEAMEALADHLVSEGYQKEMQLLSDSLSAPDALQKGPKADENAHDYACRLIWKRYRKLCKIASSITNDSRDSEVHALRIHCKKLRYLLEFFAPAFPGKEIKGLVKPMKRLQDNLGAFNDCSVQIEALSTFLGEHKFRDKATQLAIAQSVGALVAILHQRQETERLHVVENFERFDNEETRQMFRALFKPHEGPVEEEE